ncbi:hypothetical protein FE810_03450 [Thalassotalea litorea]|uniref:Uncharacterized protein n=1 Tax=Thalassotalea litorea TaxID=2020715 RepID=A0A5R9IRV0_9GAMM|nr:hypothetical protein [Thalassotalea litorea]TLU67349.1 hypothetical protein FE810_03450 [Thalassotalea litorea]
MKNTLAVTLLALLVSTSANAEISYSKYTEQESFGPYARLLTSFNEVKVVKTANGGEITCRVDVSNGDTVVKGKERSVTESELAISPLKACLKKFEARRLADRGDFWWK